jgi:hypothetical protein
MSKQSFPHQNSNSELAGRLNLLRELDSGLLDGLSCPSCSKQMVSVWFSHPTEAVYRTWFVCANCSFEMRAQNTSPPRLYSEERLSHELDTYDGRLLKKARLSTEEDQSGPK